MAAPRTIEINGKTYNKCYINKQQWKDCITPCTFCHSQVQKNCIDPYCKDEHVCYVDLSAIYGEEDKRAQ